MAIPHRVELPGSPTVSFAESGIRAQRQFLTEWSDWRDFAAELGGGYTAVGDAFYPVNPQAFPGINTLRVSGIAIEPWDSENTDGTIGEISLPAVQIASHDTAKMIVDYSVRLSDTGTGDDVDPPGNSTITYSETFSYERVETSGRFWNWKSAPSGPAKHDAAITVIVPVRDITLTWSNVDEIPKSAIAAAVGNVNDAAFPGTNGYAKWTVLFMGATIRRMYEFSTGQAGAWHLEYRFRYRQPPPNFDDQGGVNGWNDHWRPPDGAWHGGFDELFYRFGTAGEDVPYQPYDMTALFPGATFS